MPWAWCLAGLATTSAAANAKSVMGVELFTFLLRGAVLASAQMLSTAFVSVLTDSSAQSSAKFSVRSTL